MAVKYVPYFPTTVSGQAVLDNFVRTQRILRYRESDKVTERILRGMPLYEVTEQEHVGDEESDNMIIHGECVSACAYLKEQGIKVDLVYIDPPFASGADYAKKVYLRRNPLVAKAIQKAEQELEDDELKAFEEKMYGDIWDKEKYLNWMYENLMAIRSVMSENASIYVHLDYHIGHYVKILLDEVFGEDNFQSEIIWKKTTKTTNFNSYGSEHDTIFYYSLSYDNIIFNQAYSSLKESELLTKYIYLETPDGKIVKLTKDQRMGITPIPEGRRFRGVPLLNMNQNRPNLRYEFLGHTHTWACSKDKMDILLKQGLIFQINNGLPQKKGYLDENKGVKVNDLWTDINPVNSQAIEKADYSTQKPESLLNRIISVSSNEGMIVADFFGGSGVTAAVADKLGRKFIHTDVNINSIQTARDRLKANGANFAVKKVQDGVTLYRNPIQTKDAITRIIPGLRLDSTIGSMWVGSITDSTYGSSPVYLPDLLDSTSRVLDIVTLNRIINDAMPQLSLNVKRVIIYYIDIVDRQELDDFIKDNNDTVIEIELRDLKELLDNVVLQDEVEYTLTEDPTKMVDNFTVAIKRFYSDRVGHKINEFNQKAMAASKKKFTPIEMSLEGLEAIEMISLDCTNAEPNTPWHSDSEIKIEKNSTVTINGRKTSEFWDGTIHADIKPLRMKIRNICGDETITNFV